MLRRLLAAFMTLMFLFLTASAIADAPVRGWDKDEGYQYVLAGSYPYEKDGTEAPVLWRVLEVKDGKALMITEYTIDLLQPILVETKAEYQAEQKRKPKKYRPDAIDETLIPVWLGETLWPRLIGDDPIGEAFVGGGDSEIFNRLFILSTEDWTRWEDFGVHKTASDMPNKARIAYVTPYCAAQKMYSWSTRISTSEVFKKTGVNYTGSGYWVATFRPNVGWMQIVGINGHLSWASVTRANVGVRPAAMLDLSMVDILSGSGTQKDPFVLAAAE
ncbi:MAG: hypothetical protein IJ083_13480 [Clostridia bacterium]|nr:hypothetical protein [Clostridia bacterium]